MDSAKLCGGKKNEKGGGGRGLRPKWLTKGKWLVQPNFFKNFEKKDLRFSRSLSKNGAESKNNSLFSDIHGSDFAGSLPRCDPDFSHTKVAILGGIQQSESCVY